MDKSPITDFLTYMSVKILIDTFYYYRLFKIRSVELKVLNYLLILYNYFGINKFNIYLDDSLAENSFEDIDKQEGDNVSCFVEDTTSSKLNQWGKWGKSIYDSVSKYFDQQGSDINPYYLHQVNLSQQLLKDLNLIPIWGNILSTKYNFGRIPATSAPVEGEINKIKLRFEKTFGHSARVDEFVSDSINFFNGKALIDNADLEKVPEHDKKEDNNLLCKVCSKEIDIENCINCSVCCNIVHENNCSKNLAEKIICVECLKKQDIRKSIGLEEFENWRGKGLPIKKKLQEKKQSSSCIACSMGNFPTSDRKCFMCKKNIHHLDGCSIALNNEEEGYAEKRICLDCFNLNVQPDNFNEYNKQTSNVEDAQFELQNSNKPEFTQESLSPQNNKKNYRKPAKYLGERKSDVSDSIRWNKNKCVPVIKNGNNVSLSKVSLQGKEVALRNTCAFDSIFYILMIAVEDFPHLKDKVKFFS